jgi:hypothetical protein
MADDARLREMYAASAETVRPDHPGDEVWEALATGELAPKERERLFDHVAACAACASVYRGVRMLETEARVFDRGVPREDTRPARPAVRVWFAGLAAAAVLALAFFLPLRPASSPPKDGVRGPDVSTPLAIAPVGDLAAPPSSFRWTPLSSAARHRVELSHADGDPLWTSADLEGSEAAWPKDIRLGPGTYYWRVVAVPDPDRRLSSPVASPLVSFRIR